MKKGDLVRVEGEGLWWRRPTTQELAEWTRLWGNSLGDDGEMRLAPLWWRAAQPTKPVFVLSARSSRPPGSNDRRRGWCQVLDPATGLPMWVLRASCVVV
jgi:hypothetical protein